MDARILRPLRSKLPAVWSDTLNAPRGLKDHSFHMLVLDGVLGLEVSNFSRQLKMKPGIEDDHQVMVDMSNDLWLGGIEVHEDGKLKRHNARKRKIT